MRAVLMIAGGAGVACGCNLVLGLDKLQDCPEQVGCPGAGGRDAGGDGAGGDTSATCTDHVKDGTETDVDCGGSCMTKCATDEGCETGSDCQSKVCAPGKSCLAPKCSDMVKNGDETDVDCGGSCPPCAPGLACVKDADCKIGPCTQGECPVSCTDQVKDGHETGVDCGGGAASGCPACAAGQGCKANADCQSGVCDGGSCAGSFVWGKFFGGGDTQQNPFAGLGADKSGAVVEAIDRADTLDFGGPQQITGEVAYPADFAFARYDGTGKFLWQQDIAGDDFQGLSAVAVSPGGNVAFVGYSDGNVYFYGSSSQPAPSGMVLGALKFGDGSILNATTFSSGGYPSAEGVAIDDSGSVVVAGSVPQLTVQLDQEVVGDPTQNTAFVAKFTSEVLCEWAFSFGAGPSAGPSAWAVTFDAAGDVVAAGGFDGTIDFGGGPLLAAGESDIFVVKLASADGAHLWSKAFGGVDDEAGLSVVTDAAKDVLVAGDFQGTFAVGGATITSAGDDDIFVAKLSGANGTPLWARHFGGAQKDHLQQIAVDPAGNVLLTGYFQGTIDFGGGPITSAGSEDVYLAKLDPSGKFIWARGFGGANAEYGAGVAAADAHDLFLTGPVYDKIDLGGGPNETTATDFLVRLHTPAAP